MAAPTVAAASNSARAAVAATTPTVPATVQGEDPSTYLEDALDWIQAHALRRDRVDWPATRVEARALASGARATADTYLAIRLALGRLKDRHSSLLDPEQAAEAQHDAGDEDPEARRLGGGIGTSRFPPSAASIRR
jgi:hypothetical protein